MVDENNWNCIPERPGVYFFYLDNITGCKLGLYRNTSHSNDDLELAKRAMLKKMNFTLNFLRGSRLEGHLVEKNRSKYFRKSFSISALEVVAKNLISEMENIPIFEIQGFIELIEKTALMNKPIYIGITENQTLKERYCQHRANYADSVEGTFGGRLRISGLSWGDTSFSFVEMGIRLADNSSILKNLEKYLQGVCDPVLSKK